MAEQDYPFIRAYGRIMGSHAYYIEGLLILARKDKAPQDAWYHSGGLSTDPTPRVWHRAADLANHGPHSLRARFEAMGLYDSLKEAS